MLYKLQLINNSAEATKIICCEKGEGTVIHKWFKKFRLGCKNLDNQASSSGFRGCSPSHRDKYTERVSGKLGFL